MQILAILEVTCFYLIRLLSLITLTLFVCTSYCSPLSDSVYAIIENSVSLSQGRFNWLYGKKRKIRPAAYSALHELPSLIRLRNYDVVYFQLLGRQAKVAYTFLAIPAGPLRSSLQSLPKPSSASQPLQNSLRTCFAHYFGLCVGEKKKRYMWKITYWSRLHMLIRVPSLDLLTRCNHRCTSSVAQCCRPRELKPPEFRHVECYVDSTAVRVRSAQQRPGLTVLTMTKGDCVAAPAASERTAKMTLWVLRRTKSFEASFPKPALAPVILIYARELKLWYQSGVETSGVWRSLKTSMRMLMFLVMSMTRGRYDLSIREDSAAGKWRWLRISCESIHY